MSNHPLGVALIKYACPICGQINEDASEIALGSLPNDEENIKNVEAMNNQIVGFSEKPCKKCQSYIDQGAFMIIGVDSDKTDDERNPYRTGHIVGIKKTSEFYKHLLDEYKVKDAIFMDYRDMKKFGLIND
jgi:hypothetical protein